MNFKDEQILFIEQSELIGGLHKWHIVRPTCSAYDGYDRQLPKTIVII